jgi:hypothetical protein
MSFQYAGDFLRKVSNLVFIFGQIFASYITDIFGFGVSIRSASQDFPIILVPVGYTFSIWLLIFALLIAYGIFQILPSQSNNILLRKIGFHTASAFGLTTIWVTLTQLYDLQHLDFIFVVAILFFLMLAVIEINKAHLLLLKLEYYFIHVPISTITGWMNVVAMLTVASALKYSSLDNLGLSDTVISVLLLGVGTFLAFLVNFYINGNFFYIAPVIWGFAGIALANFADSNFVVALFSVIFIFILMLSFVFAKLRVKHKNIFRKNV